MEHTEPRLRGTHRTLAVVSDNPRYAKSLEPLVETVGFAVRPFGSLDEFDARAGYRVVDALLADMRLPGRSGLQFCEDLRDRGILLPVILTSAVEPDAAEAVRGCAAGTLGILTLPYRHPTLLDLLLRSTAAHERARELEECLGSMQAEYDTLTERQRIAFWETVSGRRYRDIARQLKVKVGTFDRHRRDVKNALGLASGPAIVAYGCRLRQIESELHTLRANPSILYGPNGLDRNIAAHWRRLLQDPRRPDRADD